MKRSKFFQKILYNWQIKLVSLVLAVFTFFVFSYALQETRTITVPVKILLPEGYEPQSLVPESIDLVIRGTEDQVYMVDGSRIGVSADFSVVKTEGVTTVPVSIDLEQITGYLKTSGVSIYTNPSQLKIYFTKKTSD